MDGLDELYADGNDLARDINRYYLDSWIQFNLHLDSGERCLHAKPDDVIIVLPAIPYPEDDDEEIIIEFGGSGKKKFDEENGMSKAA